MPRRKTNNHTFQRDFHRLRRLAADRTVIVVESGGNCSDFAAVGRAPACSAA
jgi:hypothetical protein